MVYAAESAHLKGLIYYGAMTDSTASETLTESRSRRRRLCERSALWCAVATILWAGGGVALYSTASGANSPRQADVLFVLGPPNERLEYAKQLMDQGVADTLAVSVPRSIDDEPRPALCDEQRPYRVFCFQPNPFTTQGEARALQRLSRENDWNSAMVLTGQFHVARANVILHRCYEGDLGMLVHAQDLPLLSFTNPKRSLAYLYAYETGAFVKAAVNQDC